MQYLMDNGYLKDILTTYGAQDAALTTAELNPANERLRISWQPSKTALS